MCRMSASAPFRPDTDIAAIAGLPVPEPGGGGVNEGCRVDRVSRIVL